MTFFKVANLHFVALAFSLALFCSCADDLKTIEWTGSEISSSSENSSSSSLNYVQQVSSSSENNSSSSSSYEQNSSSSSSSSSSYEHSSSSGVSEKCEWEGSNVIVATETMAIVNGGSNVTADKGCNYAVPQWAANNMIITNIKCGDIDCPNIKIKNPRATGHFIDERDKQIYQIVTIEGKPWMAENLNYDGDIGNNYGKLYDWETAKTACQVGGWRLPNDQDLISLAKTNEVLSRDRVVALTLCNENHCNNTGFTALATGGNHASWWSSVEQAQQVRILEINTSLPTQQSAGSIYFSPKTTSHSIRCVR